MMQTKLFLVQCALLEAFPDIVFERQGDRLRFWIQQEDRGNDALAGEVLPEQKALVLPTEEAQRLWRIRKHTWRLQRTIKSDSIDE